MVVSLRSEAVDDSVAGTPRMEIREEGNLPLAVHDLRCVGLLVTIFRGPTVDVSVERAPRQTRGTHSATRCHALVTSSAFDHDAGTRCGTIDRAELGSSHQNRAADNVVRQVAARFGSVLLLSVSRRSRRRPRRPSPRSRPHSDAGRRPRTLPRGRSGRRHRVRRCRSR